jgi:hypothetical protein
MSFGFNSVVPVRSNTYSYAHVIGEEPTTYIYGSGSNPAYTITDSRFIFNTLLSNQPQDGIYDTSTGIFTVGTGGRFGIGYSIRSTGASAGGASILLRKNGQTFVFQILSFGPGTYTNAFVFSTFAGDQIDIFVQGTETFDQLVSSMYIYDL